MNSEDAGASLKNLETAVEKLVQYHLDQGSKLTREELRAMSEGLVNVLLVSKGALGKAAKKDLFRVVSAQWIYESGWGTSKLSYKYKNFAGIKFRKELDHLPGCKSVEYTDWEGTTHQAYSCSTYNDFVKLYWAFLERTPYIGHTRLFSRPRRWLRFIAEQWVWTISGVDREDFPRGRRGDRQYKKAVRDTYCERIFDLMDRPVFKELVKWIDEEMDAPSPEKFT
ncbi:MAG: glucosaminidase domain-containing protein [Verrucomicrobiales bacterium]|nr:glucosaminidase domain-containing protein [Verrucomicrobiales bacterium]